MSISKHAARAARRASSGRSRRQSARHPANRSLLGHLERRELLAAHIVGSTASYATIQAAVNAAAAGAVIDVDAGTYGETVTVNKSLTIRGAQAGVDARTRSTASESIVYATQTAFYVGANDVTIDGFTIEGDDANIGAAQGAGVLMAPSIAGTHVVNDVIQNNVTGIYLSNDSNTDQCLIQHDLIQNNFEAGNSWTLAVGENGSRGIYTDGTVSGGYLTNVLIDSNKLYNSNFNGGDEDEGMIALQALTAAKQFNIAITDNQIGNESKALLATNVTNLVFTGNTITGLDDGPSGPVRFEGDANTVDVQYNTITGNAGPGVAVDSSGVPGGSSGFTVDDNNIYNNDGSNKIGVVVTASVYDGPLTAVGDYWGSTSGPSGLGTGTGSAVWGNGNTGHGVTATGLSGGGPVAFSPWATSLINITRIPAPAAATGLSATPVSSSSVQLSWTPAISTATSQLLQRSTDGVNFATVATLPPLLNSYADTGLTAGTAYTYRVVAANATGPSPASGTAKGTTLSAAGGTVPVSGLSWVSATAGYGTVQKNASILGDPLTLAGTVYPSGLGTHAASTITYNLAGNYTTFASTVGIDQEEDGKGTGHVDFQVVGGGKVLFDSGVLVNDQTAKVSVSVAGVQQLQLVATNGIANDIDYDHADWAGATLTLAGTVAVPAAPTGVKATALTTTTASVAWAAVAGATSYAFDRSADGGTTWATVSTTVAATPWADPTVLTPGTTYDYRVRAVNAAGPSADSAVAAVTTPAKQTATALSSLTPTSATAGWGTVQANTSVAGNPITVAGTVYASGVGTHAASTITYNLAGAYTTFNSTVGIDQEEDGKGSAYVHFQVYGDGVLLFDSGVLTNDQAAHLAVSVAGVKTLTLVATNGIAGNIDYDHADWANAQLLA